jgi:hypothetical protein
LKARWTNGLSTEDSKKFKADLLAAELVLKRLSEMLKDDLDTSLKKAASADSYTSPAWSEKMADALGEQRTLRKVIDLINIEDQ